MHLCLADPHSSNSFKMAPSLLLTYRSHLTLSFRPLPPDILYICWTHRKSQCLLSNDDNSSVMDTDCHCQLKPFFLNQFRMSSTNLFSYAICLYCHILQTSGKFLHPLFNLSEKELFSNYISCPIIFRFSLRGHGGGVFSSGVTMVYDPIL